MTIMKDIILKYFSRLLAVLGCSTLVTACYGTPYDDFHGTVAGTVLDADTGEPVPGISVRVTPGYRSQSGGNAVQSLVPTGDPVEYITDADGRFEDSIYSFREPDGILFECIDIDGEANGSYFPKSQVSEVAEAADMEITLERKQD